MKTPLLTFLRLLLPIAAKWVEREERKILKSGVPLSENGLLDASLMGVAHPEKIRLLRVERIPLLNSALMKALSRLIPTISPNTVGLSLRYGIYIRARYWGDRHLIAHECVHTGQYERHCSIAEFLRAYFTECIETGYPDAPMEQEAILRSAALLAEKRGK
jgi:hypothetical protein